MEKFASILDKRIMIIDGAMGSYIKQKFTKEDLTEEKFRGEMFKDHDKKYSVKGNNDLLNLTQPQVIASIHEDYLEAGADFVTTNTFSSTQVEQKKYGLEKYAYKMAVAGAKIARECCDKYTKKNPEKPRFVLGSIGPQSKSLSISTDVNDPSKRSVTFDELTASYYEQIRGLVDGGADVLLIETIFDTLNSKAAIYAALNYYEKTKTSQKDLPLMMSATCEKSGRTLSGQTVESFYISTKHSNMFCVGLNCGHGGNAMHGFIKPLSNTAANKYIHVYPNAGFPNEFGCYDQTPANMVKAVTKMIEEKVVNMIGGCCGTTPAHIKAVYEYTKGKAPRKISEKEDHSFKLCGLDTLNHVEGSFLHVGERCNIAGSSYFKKLIVKEDYRKAMNVAKKQVLGGAQILDVCLDDSMIDSKKVMTKFLNLLASDPGIAKVPIMIDSSNFDVLITGLKCLQGKGVVNSLSLKEGEEEFIRRAKEIKKFGAAIIIMAFDEKGQAATCDRKIEICTRAYNILKSINFPPQDIIFDPNVLCIATGFKEHNNYAVEFINVCKLITETLPHAHISGGVSNLSFALRGNNKIRNIMHSVFLYHTRKYGMDMAIVNMKGLPIYVDIDKEALEKVEALVLNKSETALPDLLKYIERTKHENAGKSEKEMKAKVDAWRLESPEKRVELALVKGIDMYVEKDLDEILKKGMHPLKIIEKVLMKGMNVVGDLFGSGKMFLPQVIQTARVMKCAMDVLLPVMKKMEISEGTQKKRKKVLMVTVKGDVHHIGKNIVGCVLECNNYEVIDLGVMCECKKIVEEAIKHEVDIIGMSGLITPSLDEMVYNVKEFRKAGITCPVLIGGASTSEIHTAVKISPHYERVIHVEDASQTISILSKVFTENGEYNTQYFDELHKHYETVRSDYYKNLKSKSFVTIKEAREKKFKIDFKKDKCCQKPTWLGTKDFEVKIDEFIPRINWLWFFYSWGYKSIDFPYKSFPKVFEHPTLGKDLKKIYDDALALLEKLKKFITGKAVLGLYPANSTKTDELLIYDPKDDDNRTKETEKFYFLREQLTKENENDPYRCLTDYVAPQESKEKDYVGMYVGSIFGEEKVPKELTEGQYNGVMFDLLMDRLAEAFAEHMHEKTRKDFWGYAKDENITDINDLLSAKFTQGIRPALGYPSFPDHHEKFKFFKFLEVEKRIGTTLTESSMMMPKSSTCSFFLSHSKCKYFALNQIDEDQFDELVQKKGMDKEKLYHFVSSVLSFK